jgi:hypothetical protein
MRNVPRDPMKRWVEAEAKKMVARNHRATKEADAQAAAEYRLAQAHKVLRSVPLIANGGTVSSDPSKEDFTAARQSIQVEVTYSHESRTIKLPVIYERHESRTIKLPVIYERHEPRTIEVPVTYESREPITLMLSVEHESSEPVNITIPMLEDKIRQ